MDFVETPLTGETDESIDSPPPLYEDTMASIPSFSQEVRRVLNSGSTTDLWLYSRKSPSPPLDDAEDHLSTISYHGYSKFLDGTKEDTHLQIVRKSYDNSSIIPIVERVYYGSQNGDLNNITQGPTKSHSAKRQREDDNPRSEPPKRKRTTSPPPVSPNHHQALSGKRKVDDNDNDIHQTSHPPNQCQEVQNDNTSIAVIIVNQIKTMVELRRIIMRNCQVPPLDQLGSGIDMGQIARRFRGKSCTQLGNTTRLPNMSVPYATHRSPGPASYSPSILGFPTVSEGDRTCCPETGVTYLDKYSIYVTYRNT
ncbi:hypothetical protein BU17DRAFT_70531 [Hysterangium stoloniferum]|nr:hypothetical protein BU17DRAFT_70531 [Hysterangium stoloniferum]